MFIHADPQVALTLARYHEADVKRAFPRKPRRWWPTERPAPSYGGVTAVPAIDEAPELGKVA